MADNEILIRQCISRYAVHACNRCFHRFLRLNRNGFRMINNAWLDEKKANSSWFLSMLGTKEMSQIETTSYKWLIQPLLSYHTRQQTKSPRNQIKWIPSPPFRKSENVNSKQSASKANLGIRKTCMRVFRCLNN